MSFVAVDEPLRHAFRCIVRMSSLTCRYALGTITPLGDGGESAVADRMRNTAGA